MYSANQQKDTDPYRWVTSDFRLRNERDLQELSGSLRKATSCNAYSWIKKGLIVSQLAGHEGEVLDIGCGWGRNLVHFPHAIGIDIESVFLKTAHNYVPNKLVQADVRHLPFPNASFDVVIMTEVIEHLSDIHSAITEIARVLRPGGKCIISTPNKAISRFARIPGHVHEFTYGEICSLLDSQGFEVLARRGCTIPYIPENNPVVWLDSNPFFFLAWKLLNRLLSPFISLKWDLIVLAQLNKHNSDSL